MDIHFFFALFWLVCVLWLKIELASSCVCVLSAVW